MVGIPSHFTKLGPTDMVSFSSRDHKGGAKTVFFPDKSLSVLSVKKCNATARSQWIHKCLTSDDTSSDVADYLEVLTTVMECCLCVNPELRDLKLALRTWEYVVTRLRAPFSR
jgi:hypothetical protein